MIKIQISAETMCELENILERLSLDPEAGDKVKRKPAGRDRYHKAWITLRRVTKTETRSRDTRRAR